MSFLKPEIVAGPWLVVETTDGSFVLPADLVGGSPSLMGLTEYCEGEPLSFETVEGWCGRLSAPGYLDCTEWSGPYATTDKARKALADTFPEAFDPDPS